MESSRSMRHDPLRLGMHIGVCFLCVCQLQDFRAHAPAIVRSMGVFIFCHCQIIESSLMI